MAEMVRMSFQDSERPIHLLQQYYPRELMGQSHFAEGENRVGTLPRLVTESISRANGEDDWQGAGLVLADELGQFFGREMLATGIEHDQPTAWSPAVATAEL